MSDLRKRVLMRMKKAELLDDYLWLEERFERYTAAVKRLEEQQRRHPFSAFVELLTSWRRK